MNEKCDMFPEDEIELDQSTPTEVSKKGEVTTDQPQLKIDPDFLMLCRPQKDSGHDLLEKDLKENGCRDPIVYWRGPDTIVDGHQRYEICNRLEIPYRVTPLDFKTKADAKNWIIESHFSCRNLSGIQRSYECGERYLNEKKAPHRPFDSDEGNTGETAQRIGKMLGVSPATVERNGVLAEAIDGLRETADDKFVGKLLDSKIKLSMRDINELSKRPPEEVTAIVELLEQGKKFAEAEGIINPTAETAPTDKNIQRVEGYLGKTLKTLSKVETTTESAKLEELLATIQQIHDRIMEIGGSSSDHSSDDGENGPDTGPQEDNEIVPDKDDRAASEEHPEESDPIIPVQDEDDEPEDYEPEEKPEEWHDDPHDDEDTETGFDGYGTDPLDYYATDDIDPAALPSW